MKIKSLLSRYRWVICFVLLISVYLTLRHIIVWYKTRPPNHIRVYDLTWSGKTDENEAGEDEGDVVYHKWRYFIETKTKLPRKIEKYSKHDPDDEYTLEETLVIEYPNDEQIRQAVKDAGF